MPKSNTTTAPAPALPRDITISANNPFTFLREVSDAVRHGYEVPSEGMLVVSHAQCLVDMALTEVAA